MKMRVKCRTILTALLSALCIVISAIITLIVLAAPRKTAVAELADNAHGYYYLQLKNSKLAERLYNALWDMHKQGYFEKCTKQHGLSQALT